MLQRLRNYIKRIFLTKTGEDALPRAAYSILGESRTRLEDYGIIHSVMGESRTRLEDYLEVKKEPVPSSPAWEEPPLEDFPSEDTEVYPLDDVEAFDLLEEDPEGPIEYAESSRVSDFDTLERTIESDSPPAEDIHLTAGILRGMEGTRLYEAMQRNETIRGKVSSLIRRVESEGDWEVFGLADMSRFLETV